MSDPYNQYGHQQYGSPAPSGGYGTPASTPYDPNNPQQHQGYPPQQQQYGQPQQYDQSQQYGQYGPPAAGGFQHGQAPYQDPNAPQGYGAAPQAPAYHDLNAQGQYVAPAYGQQDTRQQYPSAPSNQYPQQGPYSQTPYDANNPQANYQAGPGGAPGGAQEGDRGLMGALAGGAAGAFGGHKMGGHSIIGGLAGAFLGSKLEDKAKHSKPDQGYGKW